MTVKAENSAGADRGPLRLRKGWTATTSRSHDRWTIDDIRREFERYCELVNASGRKPTTKTTYIQHADRFVRWLAGEIEI